MARYCSWISSLSVAALATAGCARRAPAPILERSNLAGCYSLSLASTNGLRNFALPTKIELTETRGGQEFGGDARRVRPTFSSERWASAFWDQREDSVFVTWTNGFQVYELRLRARADSLYGTAHSSTDIAPGSGPTVPAVARRAVCDSG